jgi:TPR repeat protein
MYYYGYFVEKNTFEAFFYYKRAADQGIGLAMYLVASMYSIGDGVKKNESLADLWFERAANYFRKFK